MNNTTNNTTDNTTNIILIVLVLLVSFFLSFLGGYYCANNKNPEVITKSDTITIVQRDTLVKTEFIKVKEENTDKTALYKITIDSLKNLLS
jgi:hypothetical protein